MSHRNYLHSMRLTLILAVLFAASASAQTLVRQIPAPSLFSSAITYDGEAFWLGDNSNRLVRVSLTDGAPLDTVLSPVNGSDGLAWDGQYLWTISGASNRRWIYKLDPVSSAVLDSIPDPAQSNAGGMSMQGQEFWVGRNFPSNKFLKISQADGALLDSVAAPGTQIRGVSYDNGMFWATSVNTNADVVYWVNAMTGAVEWQFDLPEHVSLPDRRIRGVTIVDGFLWIVAYAQDANVNRILQYDVSNAVLPDIVLETAPLDFGEAVLGTPVDSVITGSNIGNAILSLASVSFSQGDAFLLLSPGAFPHPVAPGAVFSLVVSFDPQTAGVHHDTMHVASNDPDEPQLSVPLSGIAHANEGQISWSPDALNFGQVWIPNPSTSSARTLEIENEGHGVLIVSDVEVTSGLQFRLEIIGLPLTIAPLSSAPVRVWFEPVSTGEFSGILSIESNDPGLPHVSIVMNGSAVTADFDAGQSLWTFQDPSTDFDHGINGLTAIQDVNGDGAADVLLASGSGLIACLNGASSGTADVIWTYNSRAIPNHSGSVYYDRALAALDDITGDGVQDVLIGTTGSSKSVYALSGQTGEELWMFDTRWWGDGAWVYDVESFVDIDGDFVTDVLAAGGSDGGNGGPRRVFALSGDNGELLWEGPAFTAFYSLTPIQDVTGDGIADVVGGTTSWVVGINGATGAQMWQTSIGGSSPVFNLERMGNANPQTNNSEDVAVASAYLGVYVIDGLTGQQLWLVPFTGTTVYEVTALPDITGDDVAEVVVGTVSGRVVCFDGAQGIELWNVFADPNDPENVLSLKTVPDVDGDRLSDIVCGTLSNKLVVLSGWDGAHYFDAQGLGNISAVDAVGVLPDVDGSNAFEILMGNRQGWVDCVSAGTIEIVAVDPVPTPVEFAMHPAYPNPFNPSTTISYALSGVTSVRVSIFDLAGRLVRELANETQPAGEYHLQWNGRDGKGSAVATGVYFVNLRTPSFQSTQKVLLLK